MTAPADQHALREAPTVHEFQIRESDPWYGEFVTVEGDTWFVHAHEFKAYRAWAEARALAAEAENTRLKETVEAAANLQDELVQIVKGLIQTSEDEAADLRAFGMACLRANALLAVLDRGATQ